MTAIIPGLSAAQSNAYRAAMNGHCEIRHQVLAMTLSHVLVGAIEPLVLDGQINIVGGAGNGVTRTLQMGFIDPDHSLRLDSDTPTDGMGGLDRLLQVRTWVRAPDWTTWLGHSAGVFRPSVVGRDGDTVTVEAQGKECLHLRTVNAFTVPKGLGTVVAIERILRRGGEHRFRTPNVPRFKLPAVVHVGGKDEGRQPWKVVFRLARSIGYQAFFDLDGYFCMRHAPTEAAWHLHETGASANTLSRVKVSTDLTTIRNRVVVTGHSRPHRGAKSRIVTGSWVAPASNANSPERLAQNGTQWTNTGFFDEPTIHTVKGANTFARARGGELLAEDIKVETTAVPAYHLQAMDRVLLHMASGSAVGFALKDASMPLGPADGGMVVGDTKRVRKPSAGGLRRG